MKENSRLKVPVVVGFVLVFLCLDRQPKRRKETERARRSKRQTERKAAKKKLRARRRRRAWLSLRCGRREKTKKATAVFLCFFFVFLGNKNERFASRFVFVSF